jgi:FtsZ-binding cell division protein ZapB
MVETETDALASLEERILRAVELVAELRAERDAAVQEAAAVKKSSGAAAEEVVKLRAQLASLEGERQTVRTRIEKLLGQMDQLSGA